MLLKISAMMKYVRMLRLYLALAVKVYWMGRYQAKKLLEELPGDWDLPKPLASRMYFYVAQIVLVNSWVGALKGKKYTREEVRRSLCLGALTPIVDDLTDTEKSTSTEILRELRRQDGPPPEQYKLAKILYAGAFGRPGAESSFLETLQTLKAQDESIRQLGEARLSEKEIEGITKAKGGLSTLLYWTLLEPVAGEKEREAVMTLGYALQQTNDMFDVYKDYQNGQQTFFTNTSDLAHDWERYQQTIASIVEQFMALDYDARGIEACLLEISAILGRGVVCMEHLMEAQKSSDGQFRLGSYSRKQLICDMEKFSNLYRSFRFSIEMHERLREASRKRG
jgi:hypothetical protein